MHLAAFSLACELHCILTAHCTLFLFLCLFSLFFSYLFCGLLLKYVSQSLFQLIIVPVCRLKHTSLPNFPIHRADPMQFPSYLHTPSWCLLTVICLHHGLQLTPTAHGPSLLLNSGPCVGSPCNLASFWPPFLFSSHSHSSVLPILFPCCQLLPWW